MTEIDRLAHQMRASVAQNFVDAFIHAQRSTAGARSKQFQTLAKALAADAIPEDLRTRVHQDVGDAARRSTVQAFVNRPGRHNLPPYREGTDPRRTRYAGGKLRRALNDRRMAEASPNGLKFINTGVLDQYARQWRRLNFGAGAARGSSPGSFPIDLFQVSIGLEPDPRPAFRLPPGVWLSGGEVVAPGRRGTAEFRPGGDPNSARMTRGIRATNFLDAGVRRIAKEIGPAYLTMYREFFNDVTARKSFEKRMNVKAPRPRTFRVR